MTTKKLLVCFDPKKPGHQSSDFLIAVFEDAKPKFLGIKSNKFAIAGLLVYVGKDVSAKDLFSKLVDTGRKIENVNQTLYWIEKYIDQLQGFRIGNMLGIEADEVSDFKVVKLADSPPNNRVIKIP